MQDSILLIDKPAGISSFDVIRKLKKLLLQSGIPRKELPKIGHGGTLDPFATGLLVILLGEASKLSSLFLGSIKNYEGEIVFGASTPSGDIDTEINANAEVPKSLGEIKEVADTFVGVNYFQKPPMYSAKKVNGKKLYELARKDQVVEREAVLRTIHSFKIHKYENAIAPFTVSCSSGTYVRVLGEDLALKMSSLSHLKSLRRTASGDKSIEQAMTLEELEEVLTRDHNLDSCRALVPLIDCIPDDQKLECSEDYLQQITQGKIEPLQWAQNQTSQIGSIFLIYQNQLLAWLEREETTCRYRRVFIKQ